MRPVRRPHPRHLPADGRRPAWAGVPHGDRAAGPRAPHGGDGRVVGPVRAEPVDASPFQAAQGEARRLSLARDRHRLWGGLDRQRKSPPATPPEGWPILPAYFQLTGALRANIIYVTGNIRSGEKCHIYG